MVFSKGHNRDQGAIGWISTADIFILTTVLFFLLCNVLTREQIELREQLKIEGSPSHDSVIDLQQRLDAKSDELSAKEDAIQKRSQDIEKQLQLIRQQQTVFDSRVTTQRRLNNQLLGLGGSLRNVAILVDVSKSMKSATNSLEGENSWKRTKTIIGRWLNNLDVENASLILFGDTASVRLPMAMMDAEHRQKFVGTLERVDPSDESTNFLAAFRMAYAQPGVDTIIVFSDGLPTIDVEGKRIEGPRIRRRNEEPSDYSKYRDELIQDNVRRVLEVHRLIQQLAKEHPLVAINAIGLGDRVYTPQTGNLLNDLALRNRGVFIAIPSN